MSMPVNFSNAPWHLGLSKVEPMSCSPQNAFKGMQGMSACTPQEDSLPSMLHMQMRHCLTQYCVMHRCIRNCINTKCLNISSGVLQTSWIPQPTNFISQGILQRSRVQLTPPLHLLIKHSLCHCRDRNRCQDCDASRYSETKRDSRTLIGLQNFG